MKRNIFFITFSSLLLSLQTLAFLIFIFRFFPANSSLSNFIYPEFADFLQPKHDTFLYRFFVAVAFFIQAGALWIWRKQIQEKDFIRRRFSWAYVEALLTFFLFTALFKMAVYKECPDLTQNCFYVLLGLIILNKIFWCRIYIYITKLKDILTRYKLWCNRLAGVTIVLIVFFIAGVRYTHISDEAVTLIEELSKRQFLDAFIDFILPLILTFILLVFVTLFLLGRVNCIKR